MKKVLLQISLAVALLVGMIALAKPGTAQHTGKPQEPTAAASAQSEMQTPEAKDFTGTIVKDGKKFVLKGNVTNMIYQLNDQDKAKQFEGKEVRVTGKLATTGDLVYVENIEIAFSRYQ